MSAVKLIAKLNDANRKSLTDNFVRNGTGGYLYQLYMRKPETIGNIADNATSKTDRAFFAKAYYDQDDVPDFSFLNKLDKSSNRIGNRNLAKDLLMQVAKAEAPADDEKALAKIQQAMVGNIGKWDNSTLRQIVLANNQGSAASPMLILGENEQIIMDIPGIQGLVDYDQIVIGEMKHATVASFEKPTKNVAKKIAKNKKS